MVNNIIPANLHSDDHPSGPGCAASEHGWEPSAEDYEDPTPPPPATEHGAHTNAQPVAARVNPSFVMSSTSLLGWRVFIPSLWSSGMSSPLISSTVSEISHESSCRFITSLWNWNASTTSQSGMKMFSTALFCSSTISIWHFALFAFVDCSLIHRCYFSSSFVVFFFYFH